MANVPVPAGFDEMPVEDQIEYVESLWERIAANPESVPVPQWHQTVIDERLAVGGPSKNWDDLRETVRDKFTKSPR